MTTVYISGPMTGLPQFNKPAFDKAAMLLHTRGFEVLSPADIELEGTPGWEDYMKECIIMLCKSDLVVLLPGWMTSSGAHLELHLAHRLKIPMQHLETLLAA